MQGARAVSTIAAMPKRPNGTGSIFRRGRLWWVKYYRAGKSYSESSHSEFDTDARNLLARRLGDIATGKFQGLAPERVTIAELCQLVIEDYAHAKKRDIANVKWRVDKHLEPMIGTVRAPQFGLQQFKRYVADRRRAGAADATINREMAIVRRGFTLALQNDPPLVNRAPHIPKLDEDNVREGFVEDVQYRALRDKLPTHLRCLLVVGYHVGCRIGELRQVRWDQVDFAANEIKLAKRQTKAKAARTLPIYGDMREWLLIQKAERDQDWPECPLVFHYLGRPIGSHIKGWSNACTAAGLPGLHFHDLRRSAVRNMERAGIPRKIATSISGHKTESVYRRYDIVSPQDLKIAAAKMENYLGELRAGGNNPVATKVERKGGESSNVH
jgi:integrase